MDETTDPILVGMLNDACPGDMDDNGWGTYTFDSHCARTIIVARPIHESRDPQNFDLARAWSINGVETEAI